MTHQPPGSGATLGQYELGELLGEGATLNKISRGK